MAPFLLPDKQSAPVMIIMMIMMIIIMIMAIFMIMVMIMICTMTTMIVMIRQDFHISFGWKATTKDAHYRWNKDDKIGPAPTTLLLVQNLTTR